MLKAEGVVNASPARGQLPLLVDRRQCSPLRWLLIGPCQTCVSDSVCRVSLVPRLSSLTQGKRCLIGRLKEIPSSSR